MRDMRQIVGWFVATSALAPCLVQGQELPTLTSVAVRTTVDYSSASTVFSYHYVVSNPASNHGEFSLIELDISRPVGGTTLGSDNLVNGSGFAAELSRVAQQAPESVPMIPVGLRAPLEWAVSLGVNGTAGWFTRDELVLQPGQTLSGLQVDSLGLPGLRTLTASAYVEVDDLPITPPTGDSDLPRYFAEVEVFKSRARATTTVVGPTAPPADFNAQAFLQTIIGYKEQSRVLGWIANDGITNSLDVKLNAAQSALARNDTTAAKNELNALLHEVDAQADKHLTPEAVALLKFNTLFLVSKLP